VGKLGEYIRRWRGKRRCRGGEHERSASKAHLGTDGWESVCRYCGIRMHRRDRLERWTIGDPPAPKPGQG
jgi:hypothetical protein